MDIQTLSPLHNYLYDEKECADMCGAMIMEYLVCELTLLLHVVLIISDKFRLTIARWSRSTLRLRRGPIKFLDPAGSRDSTPPSQSVIGA